MTFVIIGDTTSRLLIIDSCCHWIALNFFILLPFSPFLGLFGLVSSCNDLILPVFYVSGAVCGQRKNRAGGSFSQRKTILDRSSVRRPNQGCRTVQSGIWRRDAGAIRPRQLLRGQHVLAREASKKLVSSAVAVPCGAREPTARGLQQLGRPGRTECLHVEYRDKRNRSQ